MVEEEGGGHEVERLIGEGRIVDPPRAQVTEICASRAFCSAIASAAGSMS